MVGGDGELLAEPFQEVRRVVQQVTLAFLRLGPVSSKSSGPIPRSRVTTQSARSCSVQSEFGPSPAEPDGQSWTACSSQESGYGGLVIAMRLDHVGFQPSLVGVFRTSA